MRRDMELIRSILLSIEDVQDRHELPNLEIPPYSEHEIDYNLDLLIGAGLINGRGSWTLGGTYHVVINGLTWEGHDLLDAIRNESVWQGIQDRAEQAGLSLTALTVDVIRQLAVSVSRSFLGLPD